MKTDRLQVHFNALSIFVADGGRNLDEFAAHYPRTWNALMCGDPEYFELAPKPVPEGPADE